jgi:hypothetical protein
VQVSWSKVLALGFHGLLNTEDVRLVRRRASKLIIYRKYILQNVLNYWL